LAAVQKSTKTLKTSSFDLTRLFRCINQVQNHLLKSRRAQAADQSSARIQDAAHGVCCNQRLRGHADDPQAAMLDARIRLDGRSAFCESAIPSLDTGQIARQAHQCNRALLTGYRILLSLSPF
jgi:hypothetical protein